MKVLNIQSVFAIDAGKGIFPSYPAGIQGCRKPIIAATEGLIYMGKRKRIQRTWF